MFKGNPFTKNWLTNMLPTKKSRISSGIADNVSIFYGPPGVGKTTFVNDIAESVYFLSTDRGTRHLNTLRDEVFSWKAFEKKIAELEANDAPHYDIVCIDHADDWAGMAEDMVCKDLNIDHLGDAGYGKGWKAYSKKMQGMIRRMLRLGSGLVFIAHEDIKTIKTRAKELDRTMPSMSKSAWKVLIPLADLVGYCGFKTVGIKDEKGVKRFKEVRTIQTQPTEAIYAKDRTLRKRPENGLEPLDGKLFVKSFSSK